MGLVYYPIAFFGIIFLVNAVNLTDGLDGLCTGVTFIVDDRLPAGWQPAGLCPCLAYRRRHGGVLCAGFLVWNFYSQGVHGRYWRYVLRRHRHGVGLCNAAPELVLFFGIVYIWDAMTVVIQRVYFKATHGKRIFRMTPIHHAFEMRGWREVKIDAFFALIAIIGVAMGIFLHLRGVTPRKIC